MVTKRVHDKGRRRRGIALLCSSHFHQSFNNVGKYTVQLLGIRRGCPAWRQSVVVHRAIRRGITQHTVTIDGGSFMCHGGSVQHKKHLAAQGMQQDHTLNK